MDLGRPTGGSLYHATHRYRPVAVRPRVDAPGGARNNYVMRPVARVGNSMPSRTRRSVRYGRRRRGRRPFRRNYRRRAGVPYKIVRTLKTVHTHQLNAAAGTLQAQIGAVNSCNDSFQAGGSEQPLFYDQYSTLYERYAVVGGSVRVEAVSMDGANALVAGVNLQLSGTALTQFEHYKEMPSTSMRLMTPEQDKVTFGLRWSARKWFGHRRMLTDDRLNASIGSDPTDKLYAHWFVAPVDGASDPATIHLVITVTQYVVFFKPKIPARS